MSDHVPEHHALDRFVSRSPGNGESKVSVAIASARHFFNIRGAAGDTVFTAAMDSLIGAPLPLSSNTYVSGNLRAYWLGPDEWLLAAAPDNGVTAEILSTVPDSNGSAVDVSDGYVQMTLTGVGARDVLAKGCTLDLHPHVFRSNQCAQTVVARAAVLLAANDEPGEIGIIVRRTFAEYLALWLRHSAENGVSFQFE